MLYPQPGLSPEETERATSRALREARITARLHHPNAVPVYDVVDEAGQPCLIMQFLPSTSLQELVREKGPLPPGDVARIGTDVAAALGAAHQAGIVHRDVKPGNVLIAEDGSAHLTDFGIAHAYGDVMLTSTGMLTGTPAYLAPEVARGQPSSYASDVFSLGATLYTALEGDPPFGADDNAIALLHRVASGRITPPRHRGPLAPVLMHMMAADPASRPAARDVVQQLGATAQAMARSDATTLLQPRPPLRDSTATMPLAARRQDADYAERPRRPVPPAAAVRSPSRGAPPPVLPPRPSGPARPPERRRPIPWLAILAVGVLVALGLVLLVVALQSAGNGSGGAGGSTAPSSSKPAAPSHSRTRAASSSAPKSSARSSRPASSSASTSSTTSSSAPSATTSAPGGGSASASSLGRAISDYYALLPGNTGAAWQRLTPSYRSGRAGGRASYRAFWQQMKDVSVSNVVGRPPGSAEATVTYFYKDGRIVDEDTEFGLVRQDGILKIDSSTVLSSRSR
jgi:serine/threonine protein kinase